MKTGFTTMFKKMHQFDRIKNKKTFQSLSTVLCKKRFMSTVRTDEGYKGDTKVLKEHRNLQKNKIK